MEIYKRKTNASQSTRAIESKRQEGILAGRLLRYISPPPNEPLGARRKSRWAATRRGALEGHRPVYRRICAAPTREVADRSRMAPETRLRGRRRRSRRGEEGYRIKDTGWVLPPQAVSQGEGFCARDEAVSTLARRLVRWPPAPSSTGPAWRTCASR